MGNLPEDDGFDDAPENDGVIVVKDAIMLVKNHVSGFEELITENDHAN